MPHSLLCERWIGREVSHSKLWATNTAKRGYNMPVAAILNSRQSKTPVGDDPWVVFTRQAVLHAVRQGYTIVSSVGLNIWELVTWAAGDCGGGALVWVPYPWGENIGVERGGDIADPAAISREILRQFDLDAARTEFRFQKPTGKTGNRKTSWPERDREIIATADILYPVSIRPGGNLEQLLATSETGKKVDERFRVRYSPKMHRNERPLIARAMASTLACHSWPCITHWTRSANGRWPGETASAYYRDVVGSTRDYARSALATLMRILNENRLRASSNHIRGAFPVVSFTALPPTEAVRLMRWRRRFVRWSFEPYAIVLSGDAAQATGVRPVIYGVPGNYAQLSEPDRPYFQNRGVRGGDWEPEQEWRHQGDLDLSRVSPEEMKVVVRSPEEVKLVRRLTEAEVIPLFA